MEKPTIQQWCKAASHEVEVVAGKKYSTHAKLAKIQKLSFCLLEVLLLEESSLSLHRLLQLKLKSDMLEVGSKNIP